MQHILLTKKYKSSLWETVYTQMIRKWSSLCIGVIKASFIITIIFLFFVFSGVKGFECVNDLLQ